jgi:aminopeptidase N
VDAYFFADAGIMELSRYDRPDYTSTHPTDMWSDVRVDAGLGLAATIRKFGPFAQARPLTIRLDLPVFLNRPPFGNPEYGAIRYVVGVERAF